MRTTGWFGWLSKHFWVFIYRVAKRGSTLIRDRMKQDVSSEPIWMCSRRVLNGGVAPLGYEVIHGFVVSRHARPLAKALMGTANINKRELPR